MYNTSHFGIECDNWSGCNSRSRTRHDTSESSYLTTGYDNWRWYHGRSGTWNIHLTNWRGKNITLVKVEVIIEVEVPLAKLAGADATVEAFKVALVKTGTTWSI